MSFTPKPHRSLFTDPKLESIHQFLCDAFGCHPDDLVATDPEQNFRPVVNLEPLMRILGGPWRLACDRAYNQKGETKRRRLATDGDEGDFAKSLGLPNPAPQRTIYESSAQLVERPAPTPEAKP